MRHSLAFGLALVFLGTGAAGCKGSSGAKTSQPAAIGIEPWSVQPGEDRVWCKTMKVPVGATLDVNSFTITMAAGSHHFILYRSTDNLPDGFGDCGDMNNITFLTGSQTPGAVTNAYPAGLALPLFSGEQLILQSHYVNASTSPIEAKVDVQMTTIPHDQVTDYVQTFLIVDSSFAIPPGTTGYTDGGKDLTETPNLKILSVSSHMHKRGIHFTIDESGADMPVPERLFETTEWHAPPIATFDPPRPTSASHSLHYQCTWNNETASPIYFGPTTEDEMCIMVVTVFPALDYAP